MTEHVFKVGDKVLYQAGSRWSHHMHSDFVIREVSAVTKTGRFKIGSYDQHFRQDGTATGDCYDRVIPFDQAIWDNQLRVNAIKGKCFSLRSFAEDLAKYQNRVGLDKASDLWDLIPDSVKDAVKVPS
jgi:hypothetical protein